MSAQIILIAAALAAILGSLPCAHPNVIRRMDLSQVLNKTMCPINVEFDEDDDRVPRRIKMIRCATEPNHWCRPGHLTPHECCEHQNGEHRMECVEMRDTVLVHYKSKKENVRLQVAVGCSCIVEQASRASSVSPHSH